MKKPSVFICTDKIEGMTIEELHMGEYVYAKDEIDAYIEHLEATLKSTQEFVEASLQLSTDVITDLGRKLEIAVEALNKCAEPWAIGHCNGEHLFKTFSSDGPFVNVHEPAELALAEINGETK